MTRPPVGDERLLNPVVQLLVEALKQTYIGAPQYDLRFCSALDLAQELLKSGIAYEPYTATYYRVRSVGRDESWHYVTLTDCSCEDATRVRGEISWCWHRAFLHLLTAQTAITALERCPRPTVMHVPTCPDWDLAAILRECEDLI